MSFIKGLFGGQKKAENKQPTQPQTNLISDQEAKREKTLHGLETKIQQQDLEIDKLSVHIEKLDQQVRALVAQKKKAQAMTKLQEVKAKRNLLIKKENMRTMLVKTKLQVEMHMENQGIVETLRDANNAMKDFDATNDEMIDQIEEMKTRSQEMQQADDYLNQMMAPDQEERTELEDELAEIEKELKAEEAGKVLDQLNNLPSTNANYSVNQQSSYQQSQLIQPQVATKTKFTSALEETLNI